MPSAGTGSQPDDGAAGIRLNKYLAAAGVCSRRKADELIEQARVILLNALDNADDELRATCVWTLGHFPADKQTTETCIELLEDRYVWVVRYAIEALAHFGDLAALEPLEELAGSEDESIRNLAVKAIEMLH